MKNSLFSPWYVKLMIIVFCILAAVLVVVCFKDGYDSARMHVRR